MKKIGVFLVLFVFLAAAYGQSLPLTFSGNGSQASSSFQVSQPWTMNVSANDLVEIFVVDARTGQTIRGVSNGEVIQDYGLLYLTVVSNTSWTVQANMIGQAVAAPQTTVPQVTTTASPRVNAAAAVANLPRVDTLPQQGAASSLPQATSANLAINSTVRGNYARSAPTASSSAINCDGFLSVQQAQGFFLRAGGPVQDFYNLDPDGDGIACD